MRNNNNINYLQTVAVLMKTKERAADVGTAERRILRPNQAMKMALMSSDRRADFERRVQEAVGQITYATKRRYERRQERLDKAGIFHPEANAHRVHTLFWAELSKKIDLTKIENDVWAKMSVEVAHEAHDTTSAAGGATKHAEACRRPDGGRPANGVNITRPSSNGGTRRGITNRQGRLRKVYPSVQGKHVEKEEDGASRESTLLQGSWRGRPGYDEPGGVEGKHRGVTTSSALAPAPAADSFVDLLPGCDDLDHVLTLPEFRAEWSKMNWHNRGEGLHKLLRGRTVQNGAGGVVEDLSRSDEVFRHFKRYYERSNRSRARAGDPLSAARVTPTGLLRPDFDVLQAVGRHTADAQENQNRIVGEGILSTPMRGGSANALRGRRPRTVTGSSVGKTPQNEEYQRDQETPDGNGLINVFWSSAPEGGAGAALAIDQGSTDAFPVQKKTQPRYAVNASIGDTKVRDDDWTRLSGSINNSSSSSSSGRGGTSLCSDRKQNKCLSVDDRGGTPMVKGSLEGGNLTSMELQASLETSWRALIVPVRLRLDFLQKYSTVERALDLPRAAQLLEIASKAVPLREKVINLLQRVDDQEEPVPAASSAFSTSEKKGLHDVECWVDFRPTREPQTAPAPVAAANAGTTMIGGDVDRSDCETGAVSRRVGGHESGAILAWLRSIRSRLADKCRDVCEAAWYDLGETISYQGRPVKHDRPVA